MARPSKPASVIDIEGKSHRTKKEKIVRQRGEDAMESGIAMVKFPEVKKNKKASAEFDRITELLDKIKKNDRVYETVINRYCLMLAECTEIIEFKNELEKDLKRLKKTFKEASLAELEPERKMELCLDFAKSLEKTTRVLLNYDRELSKKRNMLLAIEKESGMTLAAMLRTVPKAPEKTTNALLEALGSG